MTAPKIQPLSPIHSTCVKCGKGIAKVGRYAVGDRNPHCQTPTCPWCKPCGEGLTGELHEELHEHTWAETSTASDLAKGRRKYVCTVCRVTGGSNV